jgi:nitroreductase
MDFEKLVKERYSLRKYSNRPVEREKLDLILESARVAPTAKNIQPHYLLVLQSEEARKKADACMGSHFNAPLMIIVSYDPSAEFVREDGQRFGEIDATIAATQMLLQAADIGVGSCYVGLFDKNALKQSFEELSGLSPTAVLCFGYPDEGAHPSRLHGDRRSIDEMVKSL